MRGDGGSDIDTGQCIKGRLESKKILLILGAVEVFKKRK